MKQKLTISEKATIARIAEMAFYGIDWLDGMDTPEEIDYVVGGVETIAHMIACSIVQQLKVGVGSGVPTGETRDALKLDARGITHKQLLKRLKQYVLELKEAEA